MKKTETPILTIWPNPFEEGNSWPPKKKVDRQKAEKLAKELSAYIESDNEVREYYSSLAGN